MSDEQLQHLFNNIIEETLIEIRSDRQEIQSVLDLIRNEIDKTTYKQK